MMLRSSAALSFLVLACLVVPSLSGEEPKGGPPEFQRLKFRNVGPALGGRVCRAAGVPGDPSTYYLASAGGGVWKSTDGGVRWRPITDDQPLASAGSIALAPSDPNVIYVGAGEANIRGNVQAGNGIFKSVDAGKTWKHVWKQEAQIGTIIVHPTNPDIAFAAVLGKAFGPSEERGVYRTTDGGRTWKRVLFKDRDTGASDVCFDPRNPHVLFAGLWQVRREPWAFTSGGPGSGLYTSRDGGDTWTHLVPMPEVPAERAKDEAPGTKRCEGLPEGIWGKVCVAVAPSDGRRIYAMIEAENGGLFRSDDGGTSWTHANDHRALRQRAWYFSTLTVDPSNADVVWFPQVPLLKSVDGGKTLQRIKGPHHGDHHDIWIDPKNPRRILDSNDGGVDISINGGETWYAPPLPLGQFYHIAADNRVPYHVMGTMQDIGTASGPSNSLHSPGITPADWTIVGGGEAGHIQVDPNDPDIVWAGEYGGYISRYNHRMRQAKSVGIYPYNPSGKGGAELRYRFQWTAPILVSPHDPRVIYHGANVLFRTEDGGQTWKALSGDLTRNDKSKQKFSGGPLTGDNTGVEIYCTIFALAESPLRQGLIWAGSDDGLVHVTRDGGKTWANVTPNIPGMPEWGTVSSIEASHFDADTAYVVVQRHKLDDTKPYLFRTRDGGKTWDNLAGPLPGDSYLHVLREDPTRKGLLFLGHERGVAFSRDDGKNWEQLKLNLPTMAVMDLLVKGDDLVLGSNGRSIWILDDITPLREWSKANAGKGVYLYPPRPAIRWREAARADAPFHTEAAPNPPYGAMLYYSLKEAARAEMKLEVLDSTGEVVAKFSSKKEAKEDEPEVGNYSAEEEKKPVLSREPGLHRFVWDLRYQGATPIKKAKADSGSGTEGPLALPGRYTVRLSAASQTVTAPLEIRPDPRLFAGVPQPQREAVEAGLAEQFRLALKVRDAITRLSKDVEQLRTVRKQLVERNRLLEDDRKAEPLVKAAKDAIGKLDALEEKLHNPRAKVSYDILAMKGGARLYSQLIWLQNQLHDADGAPPQGLRELSAELFAELDQLDKEWHGLLAGDLAKLNEQARKLDYPTVLLPRQPDKPDKTGSQ
jgi:photosystem II stability/assembly factor-like uncharacterized protein